MTPPCPKCAAANVERVSVTPEPAALIVWYRCKVCGHAWAVTKAEFAIIEPSKA